MEQNDECAHANSGDKMNVRKPQVGDRFMSILHYGEGPVYLFYGILARREE